MWLALRIGILYAAPVAAVLVALLYSVRLGRRLRRGELARDGALRLFAWMLLLPVAVVLVVWGVGEVASYFAVGAEQYAFDPDASAQFLLSLVPLAVYVGVPIVVMLGILSVLPRARA
jgi:hypothetical protein